MNQKPKERSVTPEMKDSNLQTDLSNSPEKNHQQTNISSSTPSSTPITVINTVDKPTLGVVDESAESKVLENKPSETNLSTGANADVNTRNGNAFTDSLKSPYRPSSGYHSDSHKEDSSIDSPNIDMRKSCDNNQKSSSFEETSGGLQFERCFQNSSQSPSDASSCDSSPVVSSSSTRLRRRLLTHRMSVDNQMGSSSRKSLRHSSPESSYNTSDAPFQKRSSSHDTMIPRKGSLSSKAAVESPKAKGKGLIASMESLAVNSLLAAQVLNLIPTAKARERNFLHGRIAANSLLGSVELERTLPNRELRIFVGTWNMNGQAPPKELNDFMLPEGLEHVPDLLAVGTQESYSERFEWEVSIQETIGPSHLLFHSAVLGTLHLAIFLRRDLIWFCSIPEEASISTRPGVAFRTKGAVAIGFVLFGTSYLFITTHLTAHMDKAKERVQDIKRIIRSLELPKLLPKKHKSKDVTANYDCVFWFGDLNFRLDQERGEVVDWVAKQEFPMSCAHNLRNDQLTNIISDGSIFREFQEGPIKFPPSYKYDPGTDNFDTSHKQRTPAYTDRILYKCRGRRESTTASGGNLDCLMYDSVGSICTSDHKPVWGVYKSIVRPGIDTIPLAAGSFNREVFLEGIKRRSAAMSKMHDASTVCQIQ